MQYWPPCKALGTQRVINVAIYNEHDCWEHPDATAWYSVGIVTGRADQPHTGLQYEGTPRLKQHGRREQSLETRKAFTVVPRRKLGQAQRIH